MNAELRAREPGGGGTDAIVIGAGLIGLSVALHLRWSGLTVRVLERGRIGDGTSSRASGWVCAQLRTPGPLLELVLASMAYFPEFLGRIGDECGYERCGSLVVVDSEEQLQQRRLTDAEQRGVQTYPGATFLGSRAVHDLEPELSDNIIGGSYFADDAHVQPARLLEALARAALAEGVHLHQGAPVQAAERDGGAWRVQTPIGAFRAPTMVNAAGAWSPEVAEHSGVDLPVLPIAGQLLVTVPLQGMVRHCVVSQPDPRFTARSAAGIRPATDGRLWLGTTYRPGSFDVTITVDDTRAILAGAESVFPRLKGVSIEQAWAGVRPVPADLLPIYGPWSRADGYIIAVPVAGLAESAIAGRLIAGVLTGAPAGVSTEAFAPDRFATST